MYLRLEFVELLSNLFSYCVYCLLLSLQMILRYLQQQAVLERRDVEFYGYV